MAAEQDSFNPYHKWLGLSKDETNPNHYRLLGITEFESDVEVISTAADSRMMLLRTFQTGKYSELSQKLLNEVSAARVCLLQAEKKAEYDEQLRKEKAAQAGAVVGETQGSAPNGGASSITSEFTKSGVSNGDGAIPPEPTAKRFEPSVVPPPAPPVPPVPPVSDGGSFIFTDSEPASRSGIGRNSKISKTKYTPGSSAILKKNSGSASKSGVFSTSKSGKYTGPEGAGSSAETSGKTTGKAAKKKSGVPMVAIGIIVGVLVLGGAFALLSSNKAGAAKKHYQEARACLVAENYERAAKEIAKALQISKDPKYVDLQKQIQEQLKQKKIADEAYNNALKHEQAGDWGSARNEILRAVGMFPNDQEYQQAKMRIVAAADKAQQDKDAKDKAAQAKEAKAKAAKAAKDKGEKNADAKADSSADEAGEFSLGGNDSEFTAAKSNWRLPLHSWLDKPQTFNGQSDTVPLGNPDDLNFEGKITMAAWVKLNSMPATEDFQSILGHGYTKSPNAEMFLRCADGMYQVGSYDDVDHMVDCAISKEDIGQWVFLLGTYDANQQKWLLYRNGVQVAKKAEKTGSVKVSSDWYIGSTNGKERWFKGEMCNVAIWNKTLTPSEIKALYEYQLAVLEGRNPADLVNTDNKDGDGDHGDASKDTRKEHKDRKPVKLPPRGTFPVDIHGSDRGEVTDDQIRVAEGDGLEAGDWITKKIDGVDFVFHWCPPGSFKMGTGRDAKEVQIDHGFWMLESEVTQAMWQSVMGENPSQTFMEPDLPVNNVDWKDAKAFCEKLSEKASLPIALPTEEQWEYACRAGIEARYNFGTKLDPARASDKTIDEPEMKKAGELPANNWGLFNMHDNVGEWCLGGSKKARVLRGTGRNYGMQSGNAHDRVLTEPSAKSDTDGFRFVINPDK